MECFLTGKRFKPPQGRPDPLGSGPALGILFMQRATVFVDGANLYHALKSVGVRADRVGPYKAAKKLAKFRTLVEMRYYIAEIDRMR